MEESQRQKKIASVLQRDLVDVLQNVATKCSLKSGKICLQSEGTPVEFRNIYIEPVE